MPHLKNLARVLAAIGFLHPFRVSAQVLTSQYDATRTGSTLVETTLKPSNVNAAQFGKLFAWAVDGDVYAQPLYLPRLNVGAHGTHDVVFIATEHDSVYAFDAAGRPREPLWYRQLVDQDETPVPAEDVRCPFVAPEVGITPTPVIDRASGTLYVQARAKRRLSSGPFRYVQRLHALDVSTGAEKFGGPVEITGSVRGSGAGSTNGTVAFDPLLEMPRTL